MKTYKTNRLFFGKYLYKIETYAPGANLIKSWGLSRAEEFCTSRTRLRYYQNFSDKDKKILLAYIDAVRPYADKEFKTRAEWNTLNFFTNDKQLYQDLRLALSEWIESITEPESEADIAAMQSKSSLVLCNQYPHEVFQYRLYIRSSMPLPNRIKFLEWLQHYSDKFHMSSSTEKWLKGDNKYFQDPFIYVIDRNQMLMTSLHLGSWLRSTQEFALRNTQDSVK